MPRYVGRGGRRHDGVRATCCRSWPVPFRHHESGAIRQPHCAAGRGGDPSRRRCTAEGGPPRPCRIGCASGASNRTTNGVPGNGLACQGAGVDARPSAGHGTPGNVGRGAAHIPAPGWTRWTAVRGYLEARIRRVLVEAAADGALTGRGDVRRLDHPARTTSWIGLPASLAEVRHRFPQFHAVPLVVAPTTAEWAATVLPRCLASCPARVGRLNILPVPYDQPADWSVVHGWSERARDAGLGVTAHAGEFGARHLAEALEVPGLTRIGHALAAAADPRLLDRIAARAVTIECALTCNVVLGAVEGYGPPGPSIREARHSGSRLYRRSGPGLQPPSGVSTPFPQSWDSRRRSCAGSLARRSAHRSAVRLNATGCCR